MTKEIPFCYGHRLLNHKGKCRHLHGHSARAVIRLESPVLDALGMVVDFADIGDYVKSWLSAEIDHNMLLCQEDPVLPLLREAGEQVHAMEENPTTENIARLIFQHVERGGFPVVEVAVYETESAFASYRKEWVDGRELRRLPENLVPGCGGFSFAFKKRRRKHSPALRLAAGHRRRPKGQARPYRI